MESESQMKRTWYIASAAVAAVLWTGFSPVGSPMSAAYAQTQPVALRPEIGKPLQEAQDLAKNKKYQDALAKISQAESAENKTAYEGYMIDRVRASVAAVAGDDRLAINSFEKVVVSDLLPKEDQASFVQALIALYSKANDYPKTIYWINQYFKNGGNDPRMRTLLIQSYYFNNEFARATQEPQADIQADEKAGQAPSQDTLKLLASCAIKQNDKVAYVDVLEKFVAYYPKKEYWADLLDRVQSKPAFSARHALDLYRLKHILGELDTATGYMEMSQLSVLAGFPAEAKKIVDEGFESGTLNATVEHGRQQRLRDQIYKAAAEDASALNGSQGDLVKGKQGGSLMNLGYAYVTNGQIDKGINLMEQGMRQGGLKRLDDARLQLGYAYVLANRNEQALKTFKAVQGSDGSADLARYWILYLNRPAT
jgi:hypothetical protein